MAVLFSGLKNVGQRWAHLSCRCRHRHFCIFKRTIPYVYFNIICQILGYFIYNFVNFKMTVSRIRPILAFLLRQGMSTFSGHREKRTRIIFALRLALTRRVGWGWVSRRLGRWRAPILSSCGLMRTEFRESAFVASKYFWIFYLLFSDYILY